MDASVEVQPAERFRFGQNWTRFLAVVDEARIVDAERSLETMLGINSLAGRTFLDVGSGSGIFSLAAMRLGAARVHSFDYDEESVGCGQELRRRYFPGDPRWTVERGDVLDRGYLAGLGTWDLVYSWGVLHHTGDLWRALDNVASLVAPAGLLWLSIYNDQGRASHVWRAIKRRYNRAGNGEKRLILLIVYIYFKSRAVARLVLHGQNPLHALTAPSYESGRGMSEWTDLVDWVGGYPFEVAAVDDIFSFFTERGFVLRQLFTSRGRHGCNEFLFQRVTA